MKKVPTKKQLEEKINQEKITNKTLFYSLAKKQRSLTGSLYRKDIIIIFCPDDNTLFYVNEDHKLPIQDEKNIQKAQVKDIAEVTRTVAKNTPNTTELVLQYPKKDQKGKQTNLEWKIDFANKGVAQSWAEMLTKFKEESLLKPIRNSIKPIASPTIINPQTSNMMNTVPQQINSKEPQKQDHIDLLLKNSRIMLNKPDELTSDVLNYHLANQNSSKPQQNNNLNTNSNNVNASKPPATTYTVTNSIIKPQNNQNPSTNPIKPIQESQPRQNLGHNLKPPNEQESRLSYAYEITSRVYDSRIKPQNEKAISNDWNFKFVKEMTRQTVLEFQKEAVKAFEQVYQQRKIHDEQFTVTQTSGMIVQIADNFSAQSKKLKRQYRNYHYILESCKLETILSVPLACLIEHLGCVCLVKAAFPKEAIKLKNKRDVETMLIDLQQRTKISNSILFYNRCDLYDLTKTYGSYGDLPRIYVDNLEEYLPEFNLHKKQQDEGSSFYVRPQLLQYLGNRIVPGGSVQDQKNPKLKNQFSSILQNEIKDIAQCLSSEDIYIANIFDLKQFLHYRGVNLKFLHQVYLETKNKFVRKYLLTCLVAKLIKDEINLGLPIIVNESKNVSPEQYVEQQIKLFIEGKTAATNECWKKLSIQYRNLYGASINSHELIGGFLLSCLMTLINAEYKIQNLDKSKVIFKDQGIIEKGFVHRLKPKIKSYYRFSAKIMETVEICKYSEENQDVFKRLVQYMSLQSKPIPQSYNVNKSRPYILAYLSDFVVPDKMGQQTIPCASQIYQLVNSEPPSTPSLKITLNYIKQWLIYMKSSKNRGDQKFQDLIRDSVDIVNYWLEFQHPKICQFYEKISIYYQICGDTEESLNILEKAIDISYKTQAKNNNKIGMRHFVTGCQYLKAGRKKQAIQNLQKARVCMQKTEGQESQYALVLLKLSSLQLNNGDTDSCIKLGKEAFKNAQKGKMNDTYSIKICQILCRAYEIKGEKQQLRKLSSSCARDFNKTTQKAAFCQMIKICLTGTIAKLSVQRSKALQSLAFRLKDQGNLKDQNQSLSLLMQKSKTSIVMQTFMTKSDNSERYLTEITSKKQLSGDGNQFMLILGLVTGVVGIDFIEGLHAQKEFE